MEEDDGGGSKKNPSLGSVLDGDEEPVLTIKESSPSDVETLVDGVPAAQAFRWIMVAETGFDYTWY